MSSYYYLMAQLPGLLPNAPSAITYAQFRETASHHLSGMDLSILEGLSLEPPRNGGKTGNGLVDRWNDHERMLRLALEAIRASKFGRSADLSADQSDRLISGVEIRHVAATAAAMDNPLEAERYLDRCRHAFIDEMSRTHYFDSEAVFAYGLMLLLHERGDRFTAEAGRASYTTIYNRILGE